MDMILPQRSEHAVSKVIEQTASERAGASQSPIELDDSEVETLRVEYKSILQIKNLEPYTVCVCVCV